MKYSDFSKQPQEPRERRVPDFVVPFDGVATDYPDFERPMVAEAFTEALDATFEQFPEHVRGYVELPYIREPERLSPEKSLRVQLPSEDGMWRLRLERYRESEGLPSEVIGKLNLTHRTADAVQLGAEYRLRVDGSLRRWDERDHASLIFPDGTPNIGAMLDAGRNNALEVRQQYNLGEVGLEEVRGLSAMLADPQLEYWDPLTDYR
ncbi:MAG TPA: hypothetical protein VJP80_08355 [Candidatus Saccharimonadales bacterium]|nr:hypothetical protein [Candidatus Saccharimonadales bacterium]